MKQTQKLVALLAVVSLAIGASGVKADDATQSQLEAVREQQAAYQSQRSELQKEAEVSEDGLKDIQGELAKQQVTVDAANRRLEEVTRRITHLKRQRGLAIQESYRSADELSYLYALVTSESLTDFLRKGEYTDIMLTRKDKVIDAVDQVIQGLDRDRQDLITQKNAGESRLHDLNSRIAEIQKALAENQANSDAARAMEAYLVGQLGDYTKGGCHRVGSDQAAGSFTLTGSGTEHGLGMSQYGAKGAALHGNNYRQILAHYYTGTSIVNGGSFQTNQGESEAYLVGVVEAEMSSSWPMEALKAQAVAARSYAYLNRHGLDNTPATQAWVGPGLQTDRARQAVRETAGQVVSYGGQVVQAFYHSTSGGCTENNENVWGGRPLPWLRGVASPYETDSPHWDWQSKTYSVDQMSAILNGDSRTAVGAVQSIKIIGRGVSGRVTVVQINGSAGSKTVSGPTFKKVFNNRSPADERGLKSTLFGFN